MRPMDKITASLTFSPSSFPDKTPPNILFSPNFPIFRPAFRTEPNADIGLFPEFPAKITPESPGSSSFPDS
jgi:hypothetical protein